MADQTAGETEVCSSLTLEGDERSELVKRIASTAAFSKAPRLRQLLLFTVEHRLTGRTEDINEYTIGVKVFERGEDFNPSEDSVVRTSARQLRIKLKEYFDSEGREETWTIEMPKGGYIAVFVKRLPEAATEPAG